MFIFLLTFIFQWSDGAKIELSHQPNDSLQIYELTGTGFRPSEELSHISYSSGEIFTETFNVSKDGTFIQIILPEVLGISEGNGMESIRRKAFEEIGKIDYTWKSAPLN